MLLINFLSLFSFIYQLYAAPTPRVASDVVPVQEITKLDTVQLLTNEWVLREHLHKDGDAYTPMLPFDSLTLQLFDDRTYQLRRQIHVPKATENIESVEWGKWQLNTGRGLIGVQVTNIDGYATLNAMLDRWQILKLTPQQLVLKPYGTSSEYLVFARAK